MTVVPAPLPGPWIAMSGAGTGPLGIDEGKEYARHVPEASTYPWARRHRRDDMCISRLLWG